MRPHLSLPQPPADPVAALTACHDRIRQYTSGLERLCALPSLRDPQVPPAAAQAHRYFSEGLPLHAADEDRSLGPRLMKVAPEAAPLVGRLAAEHVQIDAALEVLLPLLLKLSEGGTVEEEALRHASRQLSSVLIPHILLEEAELFPLCARLTVADREAFREELVARRNK